MEQEHIILLLKIQTLAKEWKTEEIDTIIDNFIFNK